MTLLILELLGDATAAAEATYAIGTDIAYTTATLRAIDLHAPGAMLTELCLSDSIGSELERISSIGATA